MTSISQNSAVLSNSYRHSFSCILGNLVEHYDTALYGFLAPFIAPLFFSAYDPITALILAYAILPLDMIAKPLGAVIFGRIGDRVGRSKALSFSIIGTTFATGGIGFIPLSASSDSLAPCLLAGLRFVQKFCSAGECVGGAIFLLEQQDGKKGFLSSLYNCSTIIGILLASVLIHLFETWNLIQTHWRFLFWGSFFTSLLGLYIRFNTNESPRFLQAKRPEESLWKAICRYKKPFLAIATAAGFSYATYEAAFIFFNSYSPLVTSVSMTQMLSLNTELLLLDMALLPIFGYFADRYSAHSIMLVAAGVGAAGSVPLMLCCEGASYSTLAAIRIFWVIVGVLFFAPFHGWAQELLPIRYRYTLISLAYMLGSQLIGGPFVCIGLWLYKATGLIYMPGIYLTVAAFLPIFFIRILSKPASRDR